ncbi:MAG: MFS transporter [Candidatus Dormibacteraeota bacterium]|nr:MFS transporter [Candidatus Dormibacteraeota bacterium]
MGEQHRRTSRVPRRLLFAVLFGTPLNPLNSSMIAVALDRLQGDFGVNLLTVTWLVNGFYLAAAVGQPLMGRVADRFGPRRTFLAGLVLITLTGLAAPLVPTFGALIAVRVVQALGTSTSYPAALAMIRTSSGGRPPARALGVLSIAANVSAGLGPVIGGVLVALGGWQAIFLVNVPVAVAGVVLCVLWLPRDPPREAEVGPREVVRLIDPVGVALFSITIAVLLWFLVTADPHPNWVLIAVPPISALLLVLYEWRRRAPFFDVRLLVHRPRLLGVYGQFILINFVFYGMFFGLPLWFQQSRGFSVFASGLLLLPVAGMGVVVTPVAARMIERWGTRLPLITGSLFMIAGSALVLLLSHSTPIVVIVAIGLVEGVPSALNQLALQTALYANAPPAQTGTAGGLFQTSRYLGAISMITILGLIFGTRATDAGLHLAGAIMIGVSVVVVALSLAASDRQPAPA